MKKQKPLLSILCLILLAKALLAFWFISSTPIGLAPDEAQYWTWSQKLDWGYYSKPPGVAWQIWTGTQLFGNSVLGVRFMSVIVSFLLSLAVYLLARASNLTEKTAFWAGVVMAISPIGIFSSFLATTDGGMILFWTLSCGMIASALSRKTSPDYTLLGACILFGALFKWPIYLLWIPVVIIFPQARIKQMGGILLSLFGLVPSLIWNASNDWATFRHVFSQVSGGHGVARPNFFDFLGAQFALLSPVFAVILILGFIYLVRQRKQLSSPLLFCGGISLSIILFYLGLSLFKKIQGNWCVFAYPTAIVFLCWYATEKMNRGVRWLKIGATLSITLSLFTLSIPSIDSFPYKMNPFRHSLGWEPIDQALIDVGYNPDQHFLFGDKYQMTSILSFYGPTQKRAYFLNLHSARKNQFSYWSGMEEHKGETGYYLLAENDKNIENRVDEIQKKLQNHFQSVEFQGIKPLYKDEKNALIFKCISFNGLVPKDPDIY